MALVPKSNVNPIIELVNQNSSRYSLKRSVNEIISFESIRMYNYPWICEISESEGDLYIELTNSIRLDELANRYYKDSKLWWVLAQVNHIKNPLTDLKIGMLLRIPPLTSLIRNGVTK